MKRHLVCYADQHHVMALRYEDGDLQAINLQSLEDMHTPHAGDIYCAKIAYLAPSGNGAFIYLDSGEQANKTVAQGFLPLKSFQTAPKSGDYCLLQVDRAAQAEKLPRLTQNITLKSAYAVLTPQRKGAFFSKQITDSAQRKALEPARQALAVYGGVIRSAARYASAEAVQKAIQTLIKRWQQIETNYTQIAQQKTIRRIRRAEDPIRAAFIDWLSPFPDRIACALPEYGAYALPLIQQALQQSAPNFPLECLCVIKHEDCLDLEAIEKIFDPIHALPSGGFIAIEPTRACIAVDVDTGNAKGAAALRSNLEALPLLTRLLKLRHLGGLIVIDFAGMPDSDDQRRIETSLKRHFCTEEYRLIGWGMAGVYLITRQRKTAALERRMLPKTPA